MGQRGVGAPRLHRAGGDPVTTQLFAMLRGGQIVADGVIWPDNQVTLKWRGEDSSVVHWQGLKNAIRVHGHEGTDFVMGQCSDDEVTP
jgi:hypothetical protein